MPNQTVLWYSGLEQGFGGYFENNVTMPLSRTHSCRERSKQVILFEECKVREQLETQTSMKLLLVPSDVTKAHTAS